MSVLRFWEVLKILITSSAFFIIAFMVAGYFLFKVIKEKKTMILFEKIFFNPNQSFFPMTAEGNFEDIYNKYHNMQPKHEIDQLRIIAVEGLRELLRKATAFKSNFLSLNEAVIVEDIKKISKNFQDGITAHLLVRDFEILVAKFAQTTLDVEVFDFINELAMYIPLMNRQKFVETLRKNWSEREKAYSKNLLHSIVQLYEQQISDKLTKGENCKFEETMLEVIKRGELVDWRANDFMKLLDLTIEKNK